MGQNDSTKKLDLWDSINYEGGTFIYGISDLMIKEQRNCKHCVLCEGPILASYAVWECIHLSVRNGFPLKRHIFRYRIQILIPQIVTIVVRWITLHGWKCVFRNLFWNYLAFPPTLSAFPLSLSLVSSVIHQPSETLSTRDSTAATLASLPSKATATKEQKTIQQRQDQMATPRSTSNITALEVYNSVQKHKYELPRQYDSSQRKQYSWNRRQVFQNKNLWVYSRILKRIMNKYLNEVYKNTN